MACCTSSWRSGRSWPGEYVIDVADAEDVFSSLKELAGSLGVASYLQQKDSIALQGMVTGKGDSAVERNREDMIYDCSVEG